MHEHPTLSVVINTYERPELLVRALESVVSQVSGDIEVLVADDGSTCQVERLIRDTYGARVGYVTHNNAGLSAARNLGWRAASGSFVTFLDDDDEMAPGTIDAMSELISKPEVGIASGAVEYLGTDGSGRIRYPGPLGAAMGEIVGQYLAGSFAIRRDVLEAVGGFDEELFCNHQFELFLRAGPYCASHSLTTPVSKHVMLRHHLDGPSSRPRNHPERLYGCTTRIIDRHGAALATDPGLHADLLGVAGVAAARVGLRREARSLFLKAVRVEPRRIKGWARLAVSLVTPVAGKLWH